MKKPHDELFRILVGISIFAFAYFFANYKPILHDVYYRYAAGHDTYNAIRNLVGFVFQGFLLLIVSVFLHKTLSIVIFTLISISVYIHISYEKILGGAVNSDAIAWMLSETRQATSALSEFSVVFSISVLKVAVIVLLFTYSRILLRPFVLKYITNQIVVTVAFLASVLVSMLGVIFHRMDLPQGNELSIFNMTISALMATAPRRSNVESDLSIDKPLAKKIVWLVDESSTFIGVTTALHGILDRHNVIDFGEAASMGNCSGPSNAALRWGVNVMQVNSRSDLRKTPTIWAYAKRAGYATTLIDGQVNGAPQNMIWKPERELINDFVPARGDIDTDLNIAVKVNEILRRPGLDFIYVVLRGAHYAYESNYPKNYVPENSTLFDRYVGAIRYSKKDFFDALFVNVDRSDVAALYTSDHGQHLEEGKVPHCTLKPSDDEFSVPLLAFLPLSVASQLKLPIDSSGLFGRSHSQLFPTTLWLMGYDQKFAEESFDALLNKPTKRYVWFGRSFAPDSDTGHIVLHTSHSFPMR